MQFLEKFSIKPLNQDLYEVAFTHESYSNEKGLDECYERLEFLGDAVLDLIVSEFLYERDSQLTEGELTRQRSNYVCKKAIYTYSMELGLDQHLKLGSGVEFTEREHDSVIADVFESIVGAVYLDLGLEAAKKFISKIVLPHIEDQDIFFYDYKSELKLLCDQKSIEVTYELIHEEGKPHQKTFIMAAIIDNKKCGEGRGGSKKEAEQNAAQTVLKNMDL